MERQFLFLCAADGSDPSVLESADTVDTCFQVERQGCLVVAVALFYHLNSSIRGGSLNVPSEANKTQKDLIGYIDS